MIPCYKCGCQRFTELTPEQPCPYGHENIEECGACGLVRTRYRLSEAEWVKHESHSPLQCAACGASSEASIRPVLDSLRGNAFRFRCLSCERTYKAAANHGHPWFEFGVEPGLQSWMQAPSREDAERVLRGRIKGESIPGASSPRNGPVSYWIRPEGVPPSLRHLIRFGEVA